MIMGIISFIFGAMAGSFFYTLALRYLNGTIEASPGKALLSSSKCQHCGERINPALLVPIVSYILLRGRCRSCGKPVSPAYPAAEIICGAILFLMTWRLGVSVITGLSFLLVCTALCISVIDVRSMKIPDSLVIAFLCLSIYPVLYYQNYMENLFGLLLMAGFFGVILFLFPGSFGGGDIKLAAAMGLFCGFDLSIVVLETALVTGALTGIIYAMAKKRDLKSRIPFAPFLTAGLLVSILYGQDILLLYHFIIQ
jgi:leader peptidase (prepilin peptidase)/N-methyltransferase